MERDGWRAFSAARAEVLGREGFRRDSDDSVTTRVVQTEKGGSDG